MDITADKDQTTREGIAFKFLFYATSLSTNKFILITLRHKYSVAQYK